MKVTVQGQGEVTLGQNDFVGAGGEGQIFVKGATAYKVYFDPGRMLPLGKLAELAVIQHPNVVKPQVVLLDARGRQPVGYTMRFVADTLPLCQIFTRAFREREGLDHPKMLGLVLKFRELVDHVHATGILIVDLNEMNFLVDRGFAEVFAIDVDSYQTRSYPATALMPSVRDWSVQGDVFTQGSDWFSFACVAYQMFTGIHPYKGKHPTVTGLDHRMQQGISVFDPEVSVPKVVYPVDVIPPAWRAWFKAVLQEGQRLPPPADILGAVVIAPARLVVSGDTLDITELGDFGSDLLGYVESADVTVAWTAAGVWLNRRAVHGPLNIRAVGFSPKLNRAVAAWEEGGELRLRDLAAGTDLPLPLRVDGIMGHEGRIYAKSGERIVEVDLTDMGGAVVASPRVAANILPHATRLFDGCALQNLLGSVFLSVFPREGASYQLRLPELDAYRLVDARHDRRVLMAMGTQGDRYDRLVFELAEDYSGYVLRAVVKDVEPAGLNFLVLDSGVCVHLTEEEKLELTAIGSAKSKTVDSPALGNDLRLVRHAGRVGFIRGSKVYAMKMK
jgi:hypothetical protein